MSPWFLFRAFMSVAVVGVADSDGDQRLFAPKGLRMLSEWLTAVSADVVSNIVQPGRFTTIENGVTIHIRERRSNGQLVGIFLDDRRNPAERISVMAETGELIDNDKGTFLVLQKGIVQRHAIDKRDPAMVVFDRYAFDLSQFAAGAQAMKYSIRERYLWQLMFPDPKDKLYSRAAGPVPRRVVRPAGRPALSARLSPSSPSPISARRAPTGKAARCRYWAPSAAWRCCG